MNIYEKIWLIWWILSIPLLLVFGILKEEFESFLWEFLFAIDVVILLTVPFFAVIVIPIMAIINM